MVSKYIREQKRYTQIEIADILECSEDEAVIFIKKMKEYGILKAVKLSEYQRDMSDLLDEDIEVADVEIGENEYLYVFTFVGIIVIAGRALKCYPKYILHNDSPKRELQQIIKVLERYNAKEQIIKMYNDGNDDKAFNLLAVLLFLIQDYYENGVYSNSSDVVENNGYGEILWDKTINESFMVLSNNRPFYTDLQTRKRVEDEMDFFRRLHECILTKASKELQDADLLDFFEYTEVDLTDEQIEDFGDIEYILYRIERELNNQFVTRKQNILKTMYAYLNHSGSFHDSNALSIFGTNSFNLVWERVCADIMDNQLQRSLGNIDLPVPLQDSYDKNQRLIDLIEKPKWTATGRNATDTLIPDLITIKKSASGCDFIIFDAKYYNARLELNLQPKGQPGIDSITKQYLYQLAYQKFIKDHSFSSVRNCFLMPTEMDYIVDKGEASLQILESIGLQNIKVRLLPAVLAYSYYLSGQKMEIEKLKL